MENVAQVLDNNLIKESQDFFCYYFFHQNGRRDVRCNPFVFGNPTVSSMSLKLMTSPRYWVMTSLRIGINGSLKGKNKTKIQSFSGINYNVEIK